MTEIRYLGGPNDGQTEKVDINLKYNQTRGVPRKDFPDGIKYYHLNVDKKLYVWEDLKWPI